MKLWIARDKNTGELWLYSGRPLIDGERYKPNLNKEKLKQVLKRTFFGKNYRKSAINNHCVKIKPMWDAGGWLAYIFKRYLSMPQEVKFYLNQKLQKVVNYRYNILRRGENDCYRLYSC
jgi:hypothetical protein